MRRFVFSLKFEARSVIKAESLAEAEAEARKMMRNVKVVRDVTQRLVDRRGDTLGFSLVQKDAEEYERLEPRCLEEAEG